MFHKIRLFTTEKGFRDEGAQQLLDKVSAISGDCQYEVFESGLSRVEIELTKDEEADALYYLEEILKRLRVLRQAYDYECGDTYADYGAYTDIHRPDQRFSHPESDMDPHVLHRYAELNSYDMDDSFRRIAKLIDEGEYKKAKEYALDCAYSEVNDLEDYI